MARVAHANSPEQGTVDLTSWRTGMLPVGELEAMAQALFVDLFPRADAHHHRIEMDIIRKGVIRQQVAFLKADRWTLGDAAEKCAERMGQLVAGDRGLFPAEQKTLADYADSCIADLFALFMGDNKPKSESWQHVPENEPDESELEVIVAKKVSIQ